MRRLAIFALGAVVLGSCYSPGLADCRVRCAADDTCPHGLECEGEFCRPKDHGPMSCSCTPGEERICGTTKGECRQGVQTCTEMKVWTACIGSVAPVPEVCDGKDNDCDAMTDEDPVDAPLCELDRGICAGTSHACVNGRYQGACLAEYGPEYERVETKCDSIDNDCDGDVDRRMALKLTDTSLGFDVVGLDGGYALAYGAPSGSGRAWSVLLLDPKLNPLGPPVALGTSAGATTIRGAGTGTVAWFVWQRPGAASPAPVEAGGATVDLASPLAAAVPLSGVLRSDLKGTIKIAGTGSTLLAAWPTDAGVGFTEWPARNGSPMVRTVRPPLPRFAEAYEVGLSSRGTTLTFAGKFFTDDAGTTDFADGLLELTDGGFSTKFVFTGASIVDNPLGTSSVYDGFCDYSLLGFTCRRSYLISDYDVWSPVSPRAELRSGVPSAIVGSSAVATSKAWAATWVENGLLFIGSAQPPGAFTASAVNVGRVPSLQTRVATAGGGDLVAVVFIANAASGQLNGALLCPP